MRKRGMLWVVALGLPLAIAGGAGARVMSNTIGPEATLSGGGHRAVGSVLLRCDTAGQQVRFTLTLTQGDVTGIGHGAGTCTGELTAYPVTVAAGGAQSFQPGTVEACGTAVNRNHGTVEDDVSWCRDGGVTLVDG